MGKRQDEQDEKDGKPIHIYIGKKSKEPFCCEQCGANLFVRLWKSVKTRQYLYHCNGCSAIYIGEE